MWINYVRSFVTGSMMFTQINNELSFTKTCIKCDKSFKNSSLKLIFFLINQNWLFLFSSVLNHPSFFCKNWPAASGTYQKGLDRPAAETGSRVRGLSPARPHPVLTRSRLNVRGAPIWPRFVDEITSVFCLFVLLFSSFFFLSCYSTSPFYEGIWRNMKCLVPSSMRSLPLLYHKVHLQS